MIRKIIKINEEKCNGCGLCAQACQEGAIGMVNGKAKLLRDDYCDGLGECLPVCPTGAISFVEREAAAYDAQAVEKKRIAQSEGQIHTGCPGSRIHTFTSPISEKKPVQQTGQSSQLRQWPVQIKLAPINAPFFQNAHLLIAADCAAYAHGSFHQDFMRSKITLIGCPKLDEGDYTEKLTAIIRENEIKSVTVVRMEVPCCGGLENAVRQALQNSGKFLPWQVVTLSLQGEVLES